MEADTRPECQIIVIVRKPSELDPAFTLVRGYVETHDRPFGVPAFLN